MVNIVSDSCPSYNLIWVLELDMTPLSELSLHIQTMFQNYKMGNLHLEKGEKWNNAIEQVIFIITHGKSYPILLTIFDEIWLWQ